MFRFQWWLLLGFAFACFMAVATSDASTFAPITQALTTANSEARSSIVPAVAAILGVLVLITVGAGVVRAVTRST